MNNSNNNRTGPLICNLEKAIDDLKAISIFFESNGFTKQLELIEDLIKQTKQLSPQLIIIRGLPGSGKTTYAEEFIKQHPKTKRINRDAFRGMLDFFNYSKDNEQFIKDCEIVLARIMLTQGYSVIIDNTHGDYNRITYLQNMLKPYYGNSLVIELDTPIEECILRDSKRDKPVGEKVITDMYNKYFNK